MEVIKHKKEQKVTRSIRANKNTLKQLNRLNINISAECSNYLEHLLKTISLKNVKLEEL